jgi:hypothetical protein
LTGNRDIEDSLERLDKLTQEEARMASAEQLKMTHSVDVKVMGVDDRVRGVENQVQDARSDVRDVGDKVQSVDGKLDQANRSLSLQTLIIFPRAQTPSQGISSEITFFDGSRPQIHPPIITLHAKLITMVPLSGFFKEVYSINGSPLTPFCGCMENVCYS